ncbi:hypothetical protein B0H16DRAFT_1598747 [Mycena metata]|uniref:Uncharacterized protein n=1 Tax=Mycena metata TaxID=1033252 RepID=A0AAD7HMS4_9AGAR|nr:hypothetical protein B0H16DRAFT_1598747 [Mycena metata]
MTTTQWVRFVDQPFPTPSVVYIRGTLTALVDKNDLKCLLPGFFTSAQTDLSSGNSSGRRSPNYFFVTHIDDGHAFGWPISSFNKTGKTPAFMLNLIPPVFREWLLPLDLASAATLASLPRPPNWKESRLVVQLVPAGGAHALTGYVVLARKAQFVLEELVGCTKHLQTPS